MKYSQSLSFCVFSQAIFSFHFFRNQNANIDFNKKKRTIQRLKRGVLPINPTCVDDIIAAFSKTAVYDTYGKSLHENEDYPFYNGAVQTSKFSYCVFSSRKTIALIDKYISVDKRDILMDATFRIVPVGPFKQLLILYIRSQNKVFEYTSLECIVVVFMYRFMTQFLCLFRFFLFAMC